MNKKFIIYFGGFILPDGNAAALRVLSNAKILRELGYEVILIGVSKKLNVSEEKQIVQGFTVFELPYPNSIVSWLNYLTTIKPLKKIISQIGINKIQAIIAYNPPSLVQFKTKLFCHSIKSNFILDITEWYKAATGNLIFKTIKNSDSFLRMRYLNFKSDGIITISKYLNDYYQQKKNSTLIPPLIDKEENKWPNFIPLLNDVKVFTSIGIPNRNKESLLNVLKVFSDLKNEYEFKYHIIGVNQEDIEKVDPEVKNYIENLSSRVKFLGRLSNKECIEEINKSHFFIFTRYQSIVTKAGFPTKFVESIAAGTPVLTNKTSNLDDYLIEGKNGYWLEPNDRIILKQQLTRILELKNAEVNKMKSYCLNSMQFHYKFFLAPMADFMEKIDIDAN